MARLLALSILALVAPSDPAARAAPAGVDPRAAAMSPTSSEIDSQVWAAVAASVVADDIVAMGKTYHPAAVLVTKAGTQPISAALVGWGKDMVTAKKAGTRATVELRFDRRQDDATTAFEAGAFKYTTTDRSGKSTSGYTRFESLLVKTNGRWQILMEHQLDPITESDWNRIRP